MHQTKKGNQYYFPMKAHIGVDADSGLVHAVVGTAANVHDLTPVDQLLHGEETYVHADNGCTGIAKGEALKDRPESWEVTMRPGKRRALPNTRFLHLMRTLEHVKASIRAKVEHPFRAIKGQLGYVNVCYRGLAKNSAQLQMLFALSKLWMMRRGVRLMIAKWRVNQRSMTSDALAGLVGQREITHASRIRHQAGQIRGIFR